MRVQAVLWTATAAILAGLIWTTFEAYSTADLAKRALIDVVFRDALTACSGTRSNSGKPFDHRSAKERSGRLVGIWQGTPPRRNPRYRLEADDMVCDYNIMTKEAEVYGAPAPQSWLGREQIRG